MKVYFDPILNKLRVRDTTSIVDPTTNSRLTLLENNEYKVTYYEIVSGTSGSLTIPTGATINEGEFGLSGNSILSKVNVSNKVTYESPKTSTGVVVTANLSTNGSWVTSGIYTDSTVALIYSIKIKAIDLVNLNYDRIIESEENDEQPTLQQSYESGSEITTNATEGPVVIKRGSVSDTDAILEGKGSAGATTFSVTGNGTITTVQADITGGTVSNAPINPTDIVNKAYADLITSDKNYIHVQGVPSSIWTVPHNLNKYGSVTATSSSDEVVQGDIKYIDNNNITITFTAAFSGRAFIN